MSLILNQLHQYPLCFSTGLSPSIGLNALLPFQSLDLFQDLTTHDLQLEDNKTTHSIPVDIENFRPQDVTVSVENGTIKVTAKREQSGKNSCFKQELTRTFAIPEGYDEKTLVKTYDPIFGKLILFMRPTRTFGTLKSTVNETENDVKINIDVKGFKSEELSVDLDGRYLCISGEKKPSPDKSQPVQRNFNFSRRFKLNKDLDLQNIAVDLSNDGTLSVRIAKSLNNPSSGPIKLPIRSEIEEI